MLTILQVATGIQLTDQGLIGLLIGQVAILATPIFGSFVYTYLVSRSISGREAQRAEQQATEAAEFAVIKYRIDLWDKKFDRYLTVKETNALVGIVDGGPNPLTPEQVDMLRDAAATGSKNAPDGRLRAMIKALDWEKVYLSRMISVDHNPHRAEHVRRLADVNDALGTLNAQLQEREFYLEFKAAMEASGTPEIAERVKPEVYR